jgi:hypothetical protein
MNDRAIMEPYIKFISAIIQQRLKDLRSQNRQIRKRARRWFKTDEFASIILEHLDYNKEELFKKLKIK